MTLSSRHRIWHSRPGGLRPSTLPLGHGGSPQYWLSHVDGEETFLVFFKPPRPGTEPLAWRAAVLTTTLGPPPAVSWDYCDSKYANLKILKTCGLIIFPTARLGFSSMNMNIALRRFLYNHGNIATVPYSYFERLQGFFIVHCTRQAVEQFGTLYMHNHARLVEVTDLRPREAQSCSDIWWAPHMVKSWTPLLAVSGWFKDQSRRARERRELTL